MEDLIGRIRLVDKVVFSEKTLPVVALQNEPTSVQGQVSFVTAKKGFSDFYKVHLLGLESYCRRICRARRHDMPEQSDPLFGMNNRNAPYSWEDCLTGIAIHEVRHRVQYNLGIELIGPEHVGQIKRCEYWNRNQREFFRGADLGQDTAHEFDAMFLEAYGAYEFRMGRLKLAERVKLLLLMTPQEFLRIEAERAAQ